MTERDHRDRRPQVPDDAQACDHEVAHLLVLARRLSFDEAVAELDRVSEGRTIRAVGRAYAEVAEVTSELAHAVDREDRPSGLLRATASNRRRSA